MTRFAGFLLTASLLLGCSNGLAAWLRRHTYAPTFRYVPEEKVRASMRDLAVHTRELDRVLREASVSGSYPREKIVGSLVEMDRVCGDLEPGQWPSNHPFLFEAIGHLRDDIQQARLAAERDPPNYFFAGAVSGACIYCHRLR